MNLELLFRVIGVAILFLSILYFTAYVKKRNALYKKGRKIKELKTSRSGQPLSMKAATVEMKKRIGKDPAASLFHLFLMLGFGLSLPAHVFSVLHRIVFRNMGMMVLQRAVMVCAVLSVLSSGLFILTGSLYFLLRRLSKKKNRFTGTVSDILPLLILVSISVSGFVYNGALMQAEAPVLITEFGVNLFLAVSRLIHVLSIAIFVFYLPKSKLFHMVAGHRLRRQGVFPLTGRIKDSVGIVNSQFIDDFPGEEDSNEAIGIKTIFDFSEKQLIALDACTSCGRCEEVCPAYLSGKLLSPKKMITQQKAYFNGKAAEQQESLSNNAEIIAMANECALCYACEQACPSFVGHVDKIVDIRRHRVLEEGRLPVEWKDVIRNCEKTSNIFGVDYNAVLIDDLNLPVFKDGMSVDFLLWIGCYGYADPRMKAVIAGLVGLLKGAAKSFAVIADEACCGEMLRSIGEEYRFQILAYKNIERLRKTGDSRILTFCPHCFHTLKKEYPAFGLQKQVCHYTEILSELMGVRECGLENDNPVRIAYHDSCYLCRLNGITEEPRDVIRGLSAKVELVALEKEKAEALCCGGGGGGGGGRVVMDEYIQHRAALIKMQEVMEKNIDILATSCPYCLNMFNDAAAYFGYSGKVTDLSKLVFSYRIPLKKNEELEYIDRE